MGGRVPNASTLAEEAECAPPFVLFDGTDTCLQEPHEVPTHEQTVPMEQHQEPADEEPLYPAKLNRPEPGAFLR
jgi:hypothetical protein